MCNPVSRGGTDASDSRVSSAAIRCFRSAHSCVTKFSCVSCFATMVCKFITKLLSWITFVLLIFSATSCDIAAIRCVKYLANQKNGQEIRVLSSH